MSVEIKKQSLEQLEQAVKIKFPGDRDLLAKAIDPLQLGYQTEKARKVLKRDFSDPKGQAYLAKMNQLVAKGLKTRGAVGADLMMEALEAGIANATIAERPVKDKYFATCTAAEKGEIEKSRTIGSPVQVQTQDIPAYHEIHLQEEAEVTMADIIQFEPLWGQWPQIPNMGYQVSPGGGILGRRIEANRFAIDKGDPTVTDEYQLDYSTMLVDLGFAVAERTIAMGKEIKLKLSTDFLTALKTLVPDGSTSSSSLFSTPSNQQTLDSVEAKFGAPHKSHIIKDATSGKLAYPKLQLARTRLNHKGTTQPEHDAPLFRFILDWRGIYDLDMLGNNFFTRADAQAMYIDALVGYVSGSGLGIGEGLRKAGMPIAENLIYSAADEGDESTINDSNPEYHWCLAPPEQLGWWVPVAEMGKRAFVEITTPYGGGGTMQSWLAPLRFRSFQWVIQIIANRYGISCLQVTARTPLG